MNQETFRIFTSAILEVSYLVTGLIICIIGKSLLEKGITGKFTAEGEVASKRLRLITSSPGLVFLIAGLMIVIVAIRTQVKIPVVLEVPLNHFVGNTSTAARVPLEQLPVLATFELLKSEEKAKEEEENAYSYYAAARSAIIDGNRATVLENLVRALALNPGILKKGLDDPDLSTILHHPKLDAYVRARIAVGRKYVYMQSISPSGRMAIGKLQIKAMAKSPQEIDKKKTEYLISRLPQESGHEPVTVTKSTLNALILHDPAALIDVLEEPEYRWLTEHNVISEWLATLAL